jgi:Xylose isomerase-like TIM barrel
MRQLCRCNLWLIVAIVLSPLGIPAEQPRAPGPLFAKQNLVAWCIVPFDAKKRTPAQRAEMVKRLGLTKVAYDWRAEHVPTFEEEILEYKKHGLEFFAFWDWHPSLEPLIKKHGIHPQIWKTCAASKQGSQAEMVRSAAEDLLPLVQKTRDLGLKLGLYNHGGWGGEPENLVKVCESLRENHNADHVGIVYNFHHGHEHVKNFAESMKLMKPYLLCVNLNGMADLKVAGENPANAKILPIGSGQRELSLMRIVQESGYQGPIGILDHRPDLDAEESLRQNLRGMKLILRQLDDREALKTYANE